MNFDRINEQLQKIKTTKKIEDIHSLIGFLVEPFGITQCNPEELFMYASVQREVSRFMPAQGFRNQAAAYTIPHQSGIPLDIKLFWMKKTTKANLSWVMALTPNYEDNPETNTNLNIGIDIVVSENCDGVFIVLSNNLKARVLELNGSLSLTQREIFDNWVKIGETINRESGNFKKEFHTLLWKSFDFEPINRKFYLQLVEQFDHLVGHLKKNIDEEFAKMFAVRLIGRTLFLWFLCKKEFMNPELDYFTVSGDSDQTHYYRDKLEPLFFEVLNTEIKDRTFIDKITPFLNGGLFEPIDTDFYKKTELTFPAGFFTQFFNVLNHYNFTVDEGTSEYEQVAVDPEMLGRVFENLLASLNDETGNQARKSKGAFYTPREIVDYMCEQSLVEYLKTKLPDTANRDRRIEELVTMDEASFREQDHNKRRDWKKDLGQEQVVQALDELKILDPAVGSGAFPMGMLNLLVKVYTRIDTAREKDLAQLKRDILSRSLYGVDIDQMAIQISRLRAWLSILVDMENLKKAEPLPNLDFKFVCANTLIPLDDGSNGLFDGDSNLKENLIKLRDQYYAATRKVDKEKIRKEYLKLINTGSLFASQRELQLKDYNPFNPLNSSGFYDPTLMHGVEAFDVVIGNPPYVGEKGHKEIFRPIANSGLGKRFYQGKMDLFYFFFHIALDYLKDLGIASFITTNYYITATGAVKLRNDMRERSTILKLLNFGELKIFESALGQHNMITILQRGKYDRRAETFVTQKKGYADDSILDKIINKNDSETNYFILKQEELYNESNIKLSTGGLDDILDKIRNISINLGIACSVNQGIVTGGDVVNKKTIDSKLIKNKKLGDGIFVLTHNELNEKKINPEEFVYIKPWYKNSDIYKYRAKLETENNLLFLDKSIKNESELKKRAPLIYKHIFEFRDLMIKRRTSLGEKLDQWFTLNRGTSHPEIFKSEKIIVPQRSKTNTFGYNTVPWYASADVYFITNPKDDYKLKSLLGILNSHLIFVWLYNRGKRKGEMLELYQEPLSRIPIPKITEENKKSFQELENIVDKILKVKEDKKDADTSGLESQVDELVMDLYGLNEEEKEIIRNS